MLRTNAGAAAGEVLSRECHEDEKTEETIQSGSYPTHGRKYGIVFTVINGRSVRQEAAVWTPALELPSREPVVAGLCRRVDSEWRIQWLRDSSRQ